MDATREGPAVSMIAGPIAFNSDTGSVISRVGLRPTGTAVTSRSHERAELAEWRCAGTGAAGPRYKHAEKAAGPPQEHGGHAAFGRADLSTFRGHFLRG